MRRAARAFLLATALTGLMTAAAVQAAPAIPLNNGQETTDAKFGGSGSFSYWVENGEFCYTLTIRNLTMAPWGAHVHGIAGRHADAGVVIPLTPPSGASGTSSGCVAVDPGVLAGILANPGNYYVNVHTDTFPGGEIRGQLK